ncbi:MAG: KamA family radical SAM protein [Planctomycetia bacterium]|nr:KamA family radical SAM protein [Planctomycetia bacterium]
MVQIITTPDADSKSSGPCEMDSLVTGESLVRELGLPTELLPQINLAAQTWPIQLPRQLLDRIERGNPEDPVLRQFLPVASELEDVPGFTRDPLEESGQQSGLLRKYAGRALVLTSAQCFARCRYCFRRFAQAEHALFATTHPEGKLPDFARFLQAVTEDTSIRELILSGGDPLAVTNLELKHLFHYIKTIPHVNRVRLHTRAAILVPERVDDGLQALFIDWLSQKTKKNSLFIVFHINHPHELCDEVYHMFDRLRALGGVLLSQTVLLKRVNDSADVLANLFTRLTDHGVLPYYLHQLDRVAGAAAFEVPEDEGRLLIEQLRNRLPGYAVPRYVREMPGCPCKTSLG